jgi:hypothetical protein
MGPMDRRLPLAVRKELLISRAQLERLELAQALADFRRASRPLRMVGDILSGRAGAGGGVGAAMVSAFSFARRYPYLGSIASIALGATGRSRVGRWIRRLGVLAALAAGGVWHANRRVEAPVRPEPGRHEG